MNKKSKRKKGSFFRRNKITILFFGVLLVYLSITTVNQQIKLRDLRKEEEQLLEKVRKLNEEVSEMEKKVEESESIEFIEKTAREKLKMVKPNEIIYIIQDKKESN